MEKLNRILKWFVRSITGGLILIILLGVVAAAVMSYRGWRQGRQIEAATELVKKHISYQPTDNFSGCVHPNNGVTIVTLNRDIFFGVKNGKVFIPRFTDWYEKQAKSLAPDLAVEEHQVNPYYLMEYCQ